MKLEEYRRLKLRVKIGQQMAEKLSICDNLRQQKYFKKHIRRGERAKNRLTGMSVRGG